MIKSYYATTVDMSIEYVKIKSDRAEYFEASAYHVILYTNTNGDDYITYYGEDGIKTHKVQKYKYKGRELKLFIEDGEYDAIKVNTVRVADNRGKSL